MKSRIFSVAIRRPPKEVYEFVADLGNMPKWATTFALSAEKTAPGTWTVRTAQGPLTMKIAKPNEFGVVDHTVIPPDGNEVFVPMRIVPNGDGSEVVFTLFQQPGMTEEDFRNDQGLVERDLASLKKVLDGEK